MEFLSWVSAVSMSLTCTGRRSSREIRIPDSAGRLMFFWFAVDFYYLACEGDIR
jgi:hypothetical protein